MNKEFYGWNASLENQWNQNTHPHENLLPGRVVADHGTQLRVVTEAGEVILPRPLHPQGESQVAVGDWVGMYTEQGKPVGIRRVMIRRTRFSRAAAGTETKEQIVAANVDTVFLVQSLNKDFNLRRMERYLVAAWESGAVPVIVLTKADGCENTGERLADMAAAAPGVDIHAVSSVTGDGLEALKRYLSPGQTVALLGSSGVGKSTLVNTLAGEALLKTQGIREDDSRGRHTTTHRELVLLPGGGMILDTPGMRSLSLWEGDTGMDRVFGDIETLIQSCRYGDCGHTREPGCAVRAALESGALDEARWERWNRLQRELAFVEAKKEGKGNQARKEWGKSLAKHQKARNKVTW